MKFNSKQELYKRVLPALRTKKTEFQRRGFSYIKEEDIWNYLSITIWQNSHELMLSDIVSNIMHVEVNDVDEFLKESLKREKRNVILEEV